jgi:hypothetical protein
MIILTIAGSAWRASQGNIRLKSIRIPFTHTKKS